MDKKNAYVELFRFIATVGIAMYHFERVYLKGSIYLQHFYICVEFFFVLSGFYLSENIKKKSINRPWDYVLKQYSKLYPEYFCAYIFSLFIYIKDSEIGVLGAIWLGKWEMFLFNAFGFDHKVSNGTLG